MKKFLNIIIALFIVVSFSSCLKDNELIGPDADGAGPTNIIEIASPSAPTSGVTSPVIMYAKAFDQAPSADYAITIRCAGVSAAETDITVTVSIDNGLVAAYNAVSTDKVAALGTDVYTLSTTEVVIKKGEREAVIPVTIKPELLKFDATYVIPVKIATASHGVISGNFGSSLFNIVPKNDYDGVYTFQTSATTSLVPNANRTAELVTVGEFKVQLKPGLLASYSNDVFYTVDPVTNAVTVECPSLGVQTPQDPRSKWDPVTKVMKVYWKQAGGGRTFEETLTYEGIRED